MKNVVIFALHALVGIFIILPFFCVLIVLKIIKVIFFGIRNLFTGIKPQQGNAVTEGIE